MRNTEVRHAPALSRLRHRSLAPSGGKGATRLRRGIQLGFLALVSVLGVQFTLFVRAAERGDLPLPVRPPGVEGFLPISGLMGLFDWAYQGELNGIHPAASILVLIALALAWFARKAFCAWICPVGTVSEMLSVLGKKIFGKNLKVWRPLDFVLRGLKYLILGFFLQAIVRMPAEGLRAFIDSPYNRVSDVKMGMFFVDASQVTLIVMGILVVGSMLIAGFWCRYLCPYGALLGIFSWFSPTRITRDVDACTDCRGCDRVCMARLNVSKVQNVLSPECTGCLDCVAACPVKNCLEVKTVRRRVSPFAFAAAVLVVFVVGVFAARMGGVWHNGMSDGEYIERIQEVHSDAYGHPGAAGRPNGGR